ncbi:AMP-binding enzyme domain-containing protein isoform 1 [Cladophialophora immunda]|nr:AMP-binding enzyme domain-containing protein isoform 1 [Cladophialophora immunda]
MRNFFQDRFYIVRTDIETGDILRDPKTGFCIEAQEGEIGESLCRIVPPVQRRHDYVGEGGKEATEKKVLRNVFKKGDEFFRLGDAMMKDQEGYISFHDRLGDTYRAKGHNISTTEVEGCLSRHPNIASVNVYAIPMNRYGYDGQLGCAAITFVDSESGPGSDQPSARELETVKELEKWTTTNASALPAYAVPRFLRVLVTDRPTGTGSDTGADRVSLIMKKLKTGLRQEGFTLPTGSRDRIYWIEKEGAGPTPRADEDTRQDRRRQRYSSAPPLFIRSWHMEIEVRGASPPRAKHSSSTDSATAKMPSTASHADSAMAETETHANRLFRLLNDDSDASPLDPSSPGQTTATQPLTPAFDLYQASWADASAQSAERISATIARLDAALHTYLLAQFWERFNACIRLVHQAAFLAGLEEHHHDHHHDHHASPSSGRYCPCRHFYSPELHLAVLAMGLRRADRSRPDMAPLLLPDHDSTLHRDLRDAAGLLPPRSSISNRWTLAQVQAVVILALLERERGRDQSARLALDSALTMIHDIQAGSGAPDLLSMHVSDDELIVQRMTLRAACLIHSHWSVFDNGLELTPAPSTNGSSRGDLVSWPRHLRGNSRLLVPQGADVDLQIYNAHLALMGIATDREDDDCADNGPGDQDPFCRVTRLHTRLKRWYASLPSHLRWSTEQSKHSGPPSLFLLHQQYHAVLILLFRPLSSEESLQNILSPLDAATTCHQLAASIASLTLSHAMQLASLLSESVERFELGAILPLALQQGALAASVLLSSAPNIKNESTRSSVSRQLDLLQRFFTKTSAVHIPAERLVGILLNIRGPSESTTTPLKQTWQPVPFSPGRDAECLGDCQHLMSLDGHDGALSRRDDQSNRGEPAGGHSLDEGGVETGLVAPSPYVWTTTGQGPHEAEQLMDSSGDRSEILVSPPADESNGRLRGRQLDATQGAILPETPTSPQSVSRAFSPLTPMQTLFAPADSSNVQQTTHNQEVLPVGDHATDSWDDGDAVSVSWSETFKTLHAVNRRTAGEKLSSNEFGDVMGCVFQL